MALSAIALVSLDEVKAYLDIQQATQDAVLEGLINRASAICEQVSSRRLKARAFTNLRLAAPPGYWLELSPGGLPAVPIDVMAAITLSLAGTSQTVWRTEADGTQSDFDVRVGWTVPGSAEGPDRLYRASGWGGGSSDPEPIRLSYTGGFATVPDLIKEAALLIVNKLYRDQVTKMADTVSIATPVGTITRPDTFVPARARDILESIRMVSV